MLQSSELQKSSITCKNSCKDCSDCSKSSFHHRNFSFLLSTLPFRAIRVSQKRREIPFLWHHHSKKEILMQARDNSNLPISPFFPNSSCRIILIIRQDVVFSSVLAYNRFIIKQFLSKINGGSAWLIFDKTSTISAAIIKYCVAHRIGILVVGTNRLWKQRAMHRIGAETS